MHAAFAVALRAFATRAFAFRSLAALGLLVLAGGQAQAQPQPAPAPLPGDSRIAAVKVYPGSATVERVARVAAGSRSVTFACLPAGLDVQSLQVSADASVRLGQTSVLSEPRALSARCSGSALDGRIREFEDRKDALQAEADALALVTGYLKGVSGGGAAGTGTGDDAASRRAPIDAKSLAATADALRRTGQDALLKQRQLARRQTEIDRALAPLLAERNRLQGGGDAVGAGVGGGGNVVAVTVTLAASADADVRLGYQIAGPGWTPTYRALLDTITSKVRIERQALVAQATGEDWRGVRLSLSTGQPRRDTAARVPAPWRLGIEPPPQPRGRVAAESYAAAPVMSAPGTPPMNDALAKQAPLFEVTELATGFATEFSVAQAIDVPSSGQRVAVALGQHDDVAKLAVRTSPAVDTTAFLIADLAVPAGVWPAGPMQLYRDGAFVGNGRFTTAHAARLALSFGADELVRVEVEPERDNQGTAGFVGSRAERKLQRTYVVENRHRTPVSVQVLEAAPVSVDEQVKVTARFSPQPAELAWNKQPGIAMWTIELAAGKTARVAADYVISYPKDARLQER